MFRNDDNSKFSLANYDRNCHSFQNDCSNLHNNNLHQQRFSGEISHYNQRITVDTETKRIMLEFLRVQRKCFEQEKLFNLLHTLENKYLELGQQQITLFANDASIKQHNIKEYVPKDMYKIARYMGKTTNTDIFSCIMVICAAVAIAMRSRYRLLLDRNWTEMINLYILLAKKSGEKKSALCAIAKHPHQNFLRCRNSETPANECLRQLQPTIRRAARASEKAVIAHYTSKIRKSGESQECIGEMLEELESLRDEFSEHIVPERTREEIFIDVATSLGLVKKLESQGETIAMMEPEAAIFLSKFFKDKSLLPILLKCYGSEPYQYDTSTVGRCVYLERPSMNMLLMLQNSVMFGLFDNELLMDIGYLPRTLPIIGGHFEEDIRETLLFNDSRVRQDWNSLYDEKIQSILEFTYTQDADRVIFDVPCEASARSILLEFEKANQEDLTAGKYSHMVPFIRKLHGTAARIAGSIHGWIFTRPHEHPITVKEMEAAIVLAKICRDHANVAFDTKARETKHFAIKILKYLFRQDWTRSQPLISASDLQRNIAGLNKAKCLPALDFLEQHNFIRQHHEPKYAPLVILHPNLLQVNLDHLTDI